MKLEVRSKCMVPSLYHFVISFFRLFAWRYGAAPRRNNAKRNDEKQEFKMALFRMAFFRLFALVFRHFAWRISLFRLFAWRYFVFSLLRLAFFRYVVFSLGVISPWRRAITPGEKTKKRNNEMVQTSHHINEPQHEISNNVVCVTSKGSDGSAVAQW